MASIETHDPPRVETNIKKSNADRCITGEFFDIDAHTRVEEMTRVERFIRDERLQANDRHFQHEEISRRDGPHQVGSYTLIDLYRRQWITKDVIRYATEFARTHGFGHSCQHLLNRDQEQFRENEQFLALTPMEMFRRMKASCKTNELSGLELKSFEILKGLDTY
jgi:hypothetical protein